MLEDVYGYVYIRTRQSACKYLEIRLWHFTDREQRGLTSTNASMYMFNTTVDVHISRDHALQKRCWLLEQMQSLLREDNS